MIDPNTAIVTGTWKGAASTLTANPSMPRALYRTFVKKRQWKASHQNQPP